MSAQAIVPMKPNCVDTAVRPMNFVRHSKPSGGNALPSRAPMFCRAGTPRHASRNPGSAPARVRRADAQRRRRTNNRQRDQPIGTPCGKRTSDGSADLGAEQMEARNAQVIHQSAEVVGQPIERPGIIRGIAVDAPKPRMSGRTTR